MATLAGTPCNRNMDPGCGVPSTPEACCQDSKRQETPRSSGPGNQEYCVISMRATIFAPVSVLSSAGTGPSLRCQYFKAHTEFAAPFRGPHSESQVFRGNTDVRNSASTYNYG